MNKDILIGFLLLLTIEMTIFIISRFIKRKEGRSGWAKCGLESEERDRKIEITVHVIHQEERGDSAVVKDNREHMTGTREEAPDFSTQPRTYENVDKDNIVDGTKESVSAETKKESNVPTPTVVTKGNSPTFLTEANQKIAKEGYHAWVQESWKRIGIGGESPKVGELVKLKYGDGDIRVIPRINEERYLGVPVKGRWKGCDFKRGAYNECYEVPQGVDENSSYEIIQIKRVAILYREDDNFLVRTKGTIQVTKV